MGTKQCVLLTLLVVLVSSIIPLQISTTTVSFTPSSMLIQGTTSPIPFTSIRFHIQVSITPLGPSSPGSPPLSPFPPPPPNPSIYESPPSVPSPPPPPPPPSSPSQTPPSPSAPSSSIIPLQISTTTVSFTPSSMLIQGTTSPIPFTSIRLHIQVSITPLGPSSPGSPPLSPFPPPPPNPSIYESPPSVPSPPPPAPAPAPSSPSQTPPSPSTPSSSS